MKYLLLCDDSVQWFSVIAKVKDNDDLVEKIDVGSLSGRSEYISNLYSRHPAFYNYSLRYREGHLADNLTWYGHYISEAEYERVKKLSELVVHVRKFEELAKL